jgi:hypothetical protein
MITATSGNAGSYVLRVGRCSQGYDLSVFMLSPSPFSVVRPRSLRGPRSCRPQPRSGPRSSGSQTWVIDIERNHIDSVSCICCCRRDKDDIAPASDPSSESVHPLIIEKCLSIDHRRVVPMRKFPPRKERIHPKCSGLRGMIGTMCLPI